MYSKIKLTETEQRFVDSFMDDNIHPQHQLYWTYMKKFLQKYVREHDQQTALITEKVYVICENILYKIGMAEADAAIESILDGTMTGTVTKPNIKRAVRTHRTSRMSLDQFLTTKADSVDALVLKTIKNNPHITRRQLADTLQIRLSTICGCVRRLFNEDLVRISGVTLDKDSDRKVETIEVR